MPVDLMICRQLGRGFGRVGLCSRCRDSCCRGAGCPNSCCRGTRGNRRCRGCPWWRGRRDWGSVLLGRGCPRCGRRGDNGRLGTWCGRWGNDPGLRMRFASRRYRSWSGRRRHWSLGLHLSWGLDRSLSLDRHRRLRCSGSRCGRLARRGRFVRRRLPGLIRRGTLRFVGARCTGRDAGGPQSSCLLGIQVLRGGPIRIVGRAEVELAIVLAHVRRVLPIFQTPFLKTPLLTTPWRPRTLGTAPHDTMAKSSRPAPQAWRYSRTTGGGDAKTTGPCVRTGPREADRCLVTRVRRKQCPTDRRAGSTDLFRPVSSRRHCRPGECPCRG